MILVVRCYIYFDQFIVNLSLSGHIVDCGDYVIVTNSRKVKATGRKEEQLLFRKHSMFPGGLKETPYKDMKDRHPDEASFMTFLT